MWSPDPVLLATVKRTFRLGGARCPTAVQLPAEACLSGVNVSFTPEPLAGSLPGDAEGLAATGACAVHWQGKDLAGVVDGIGE